MAIVNGNGSGDAMPKPPPMPDGALMHVIRFATPFVEETLAAGGRHISKAALRSALFRTVGYAAPEAFVLDYAAAMAELRATLEGPEAEALLKSFGLSPPGEGT